MKTAGSIVAGVVICLLIAFGFGMWMNSLIPPGEPRAQAVEPFNDPNDLTPREPVLPIMAHRDEFVFNCTACHSPRLTMTQPDLSATKWKEVVKKMVTVYGAKIDEPLQDQIVKYLVAVKGVK